MEGVTIRPAISSDITDLMALDHDYSTDHVWQMSVSRGAEENGISFREVRLPRPMRVAYPRDPGRLADEWTRQAAMFVAEAGEARIGYLVLILGPATGAGWVTDIVVASRQRRQGVATRLLAAAREWCRQRSLTQMFLEMQSKNFPAISLARKLGFVFSGYSDRFYPDQDIAVFFALEVR
jgi:ribosomal protein S18 acetylase RimI-like enzyme